MPSGIYKRTKEQYEKIGKASSIKLKGKHNSPKTEFKKGCISLMKGKHHSKEAKEKLSKLAKGRIQTEEFKQNLRDLAKRNPNFGMKGKKHTEYTKKKMSLAKKGLKSNMKGKEHSEETKIKMSSIKQDINVKNWKEFSREPYDQKWNNKFKRAIRKRDNQICMICEIHREKLVEALNVHHINYDKKLSILQNCISLCRGCHSKTNTNRKHWIKFFQSLLIEKYGYDYQENEIIVRVGT